MRLAEDVVRAGYFWVPENPDKKLPGTLRILDGGEIQLEVLGNFDPDFSGFQENMSMPKILGQIEKEALVTLDNCFYRRKNYSFGTLSKSTISASRALCGILINNAEPLFNQFRFSIEGLDEWLQISGITVQQDFKNKSTQINYVPPDKAQFKLNDEFSLAFIFGWSIPFARSVTEAKITQQAYVELRAHKPVELKKFIYIAFRFTNFLSLALDEPTSLSQVTIASDDIVREVSEDKQIPVQINLYYQSLPFSETKPKLAQHSLLFTFPQVRHKFESILMAWMNIYEVIGPSLNLYFASKAGEHKYLDGKFLSLAQSLETFHRRTSDETLMDKAVFDGLIDQLLTTCSEDKRKWLESKLMFGNELSLGNRLKRLLDPFKSQFGTSAKREKLIRKIVDTRNYLTHYSKDLENKAAKGRDLWEICLKMEVAFQFQLLTEIGFDKPAIQKIITDSESISRKLSQSDL